MKAIGTLAKTVAGAAFVLVLAYLFYFGGQDLVRRPAPTSRPAPAVRLVEECVEALRRLPDLLPPGPAPGRPTLMEAR
jgi:hypothetical protein